ncbi:MAG: OmpA family protein [Proteobacteria bacterium]|nr:OmpA family protein [Pseudomonadota bacterium]
MLTAYVWGRGGGVPAPTAAAPAAAATPAADAASVAVDNGTVKFYFASGKSDVASGADKALADIVAGVKEGKMAVVSGFVDSTGNAAQNEELAKQRAFAVRDQLKALGVAEDKIELKKPENLDAGAGAQARRVEVRLS